MGTAPSLSKDEINKGLSSVFRVGIAGQAMTTLTEGVFLVLLANELNAPLFIIGLLAAIPPLAQLAQLPSVYLIEKYRKRKKIAIFAFTGTRVCLLLIALIPVLFSPLLGLSFLLIFILFRGIFAAVASSAWNSMVRDLVPTKHLGAFFSRRWSYSIAISIPISLAAGFFIREWANWYPQNSLLGFSIVFFLGFSAGVIGLYFMSRVPEPPMPPVQGELKIFELLKRPFKDTNFRRLISFLSSWNFALFMASPFFTIYMVTRLGFDPSFIIMMTVLSQIVHLVFMRVWGKFSDNYSNKSVLGVSGPLALIAVLLWTFTAMPERHSLTIPLLIIIHVLLGISMSGVTLATGNIGLKLAPHGRGTSYLAANSFVGSLATGAGSILGGIIANLFAEQQLSLTLDWTGPLGEFGIQTLSFQGMDFAFFLAFLVGIYSIHRLALVVEEGEIRKGIVFQNLLSEVKRPLLNFTTIGGFREMVQYPLSLVKQRKRKEKPSKAQNSSD